MSYYDWKPYVPVAQRRANAQKSLKKLLKKGKEAQPVVIEGKTIARSFWGKRWCDHLESFSDYSNRLPRGRTYARNGSVCHLDVQPGRIEALVSGSSLYKVSIGIKDLKPATWKNIKKSCSGRIGSMLELLQGKLSTEVMTVVSDRAKGLFPQPGEFEFKCSCPDWAVMCKHVAAVLYGVGNRLDARPELLFFLRNVDAQELIATEITVATGARTKAKDAIAAGKLGDIFGIDIETDPVENGAGATMAKKKSAGAKPGKAAKKPVAAKPLQLPKRPAAGKSNKKPGPMESVKSVEGPSPADSEKAAKTSGRAKPSTKFSDAKSAKPTKGDRLDKSGKIPSLAQAPKPAAGATRGKKSASPKIASTTRKRKAPVSSGS